MRIKGIWLALGWMLAVMLLLTPVAGAKSVTVPNPSFEEGLAADGLPVGWPELFTVKAFGNEITLSDKRAADGKYSIRIDDATASSMGLRSARIPAQEDLTYTASVQIYAESGRPDLYLEFWNDQGTRIDRAIATASQTNQWQTITAELEAPKGTKAITLLVYSNTVNTGVAYFDVVKLDIAEGTTTTSPLANVPPIKFDLSSAPLGVTSMSAVRSRIPEGRPRLFARPETVQALRAKSTRSAITGLIWGNIKTQAFTGMLGTMPPEPPNAMPNGVLDVVAWRAGIDIATDIVNRLDSLAFAYLITGEARYGNPGRDLLLYVSRWNPYGTSGRSINDEVSMRLLYAMSRAYDWLHPMLTPEERLVVQKSMRERGNDVYLTMRRTRFEDLLLDNHLTRTMGFLGQAAIAFMGEIPEAEVWFDYIVSLFLLKYPPWGGDEGGWSQGVGYWQAYVGWVLEFAVALDVATDVDLFQKPFFRNTGYFKLYAHPPKSKFGAFGDGSDGAPDSGSASVVGFFAQVYKDPVLQWYAAQISGMGQVPVLPMNTFIGYVMSPETPAEMVKPALPADFPQSRLFSDIGWTLMNVDMADWNNNVHVKFKSSAYGSYNHGHAEQNSFMIEAYGSPLAISSGYYPWYGSPHHKTWTWESRSKNTILVNGSGQGVQNINAKGKITHTSFGSMFDYVRGDATQAYLGKVDRFWRDLWFVKPDVIAVFDQLEAKGPTAYDWLLHSQKQMEVDAGAQRVRVPADTAEMWTYFVIPRQLQFSQTDQFTVPPEDRDIGKPNQWHLTAALQSETGTGRFLTIMIPRPRASFGVPAPEVQAVPAQNGYAAEVKMAGELLTIGFRDGQAPLVVGEYTADAAALSIWSSSGGTRLMAVGALEIRKAGQVVFRADRPADIGIAYARTDEGDVLQLQAAGATRIECAVTAAPVKVVVNGADLPSSAWTYADGVITVNML